uniref:Uncharacterized protein n=1 Tax=Fibrocapsa japonica TaxID=94617 RepID=A0A7S2XZ20_9STRA
MTPGKKSCGYGSCSAGSSSDTINCAKASASSQRSYRVFLFVLYVVLVVLVTGIIVDFEEGFDRKSESMEKVHSLVANNVILGYGSNKAAELKNEEQPLLRGKQLENHLNAANMNQNDSGWDSSRNFMRSLARILALQVPSSKYFRHKMMLSLDPERANTEQEVAPAEVAPLSSKEVSAQDVLQSEVFDAP